MEDLFKNKFKKGLIHFHSQYSTDSVLSIKKISRFLIKNKLNFAILTDHNTLEGSQKLREKLKFHSDIEIPLAAEYKTNLGDIIAVFINQEIKAKEFNAFVEDVRAQNGLILFPHPFKNHQEIEKIAHQCDLIEVFNSQCDDGMNQQAVKLAYEFKKQTYCASDAHLGCDMDKALIAIKKSNSLKNELKNGEIVPLSCKKIKHYNIYLTQIFRVFKERNYQLLVNFIKRQFKKLYDR